MRQGFQKNRVLMLTADVLLLPILIGCEHLSSYMLTHDNSVCAWTKLEVQCVTCGGTHFINALLNGRIAEAFFHNELLFLLTVVLAVSFVLLNIAVWTRARWARTVLRCLYSIPSLIITSVSTVVFLVVRNLPTLTQTATSMIDKFT